VPRLGRLRCRCHRHFRLGVPESPGHPPPVDFGRAPQARGSSENDRDRAHHHARHSASGRAEHLL